MAVERPHVWCEVRSFVSQQLSALAHAWYAENKSRQQLDRCLAATILSSKTSQLFSSFTFIRDCMKTTPVHHSLQTPTESETDTQEHIYEKPVRDVNELKQHVIDTWSATSRVH